MLLNHRAYLAILIMTEIARSDDQGLVKSRPLARSLGLAPRAFETVFQQLSKARLVKSVRGPDGGYRLARRGITLAQIIRAVSTGDRSLYRAERLKLAKQAASRLAAVERAYMIAMSEITLEELAALARGA